MPEITETEAKPLPHLYWMLAQCLSEDCLKSLIALHHSKYKKRLDVEDWTAPAQLDPVDVEKEMSQAPISQNHMRVT